MDDLVDHYLSLMEDPRPFTFFDVERALREVPWPLEASLQRVPLHLRPSDRLSRHGVLYLALLGCQPFYNLQDHEIRDVRRPPAYGMYRHTCNARENLLIQLADTLLLYERGCEMQQDWPAFHQSMRIGLLQLRPFIIILLNLNERERPPQDPKLRGKAKRYQRYYNELLDAIPRLTREDYHIPSLLVVTP